MCVFEDLQRIEQRVRDAQQDYKQAQARVDAYGQKSAEELSSVLAAFSKAGLFPDIDTSFHGEYTLTPKHHSVAVDYIYMHGNDRKHREDARKDFQGQCIAMDIVRAAQARNVPVAHLTNLGQGIHVSMHVKNREEWTPILLNALAAYADEKQKPELAQSAREAAERVKTLSSSLAASFKDTQQSQYGSMSK